MAKLNPQQLASKWQSKMTASVDAYKQGISAVQGNPAQLAIAAKDKWIQNTIEASNDGRYEAGLSKVTEASWKTACLEKGANAIQAGARVGAAKVERHEREFAPIRDSIVQSLPARGSLEQNLERARQMAVQMAQTRKRR